MLRVMTKSENGLELAVAAVIARRVSCRALRSNRKGVTRSPRQLRAALLLLLKHFASLLAFLQTLIVSTNCLAVGDDAMVNPVPRVFGKPRMPPSHPCTLWDLEDIAHYKELLKTSPELKSAWNKLQAWGDKRIQEPLSVPAHRQEADGNWTFPDFKRGYKSPEGKWVFVWDFNTALQHRYSDVSNLGILYAFSGDEKYARLAKKILLALADAFGHGQGNPVPDPNGYDHFEAYGFDGGDSGMFLTKSCSGYDLFYNLLTITPNEGSHIEQDLIRPLAEHLKQAKFMYTGHGRWGMVCLYGVFISGVTLNDEALVDSALYGLGGSREKPEGGFFDCFKPSCLRDDRLWGADEKSEDQIVSVCVLTSVAEVMWHHGVDLYSYQNMALKRPFDAGIPPISTSSDAEMGKLACVSGLNSYEYAFRRYQDTHYLSLIKKLKPTLVLEAGELPSLFLHYHQ